MSVVDRIGQQFQREQLDPLGRRLLRLLRVIARAGLGRELGTVSPGELVAAVRQHGLNVRVLHALGALLHPERLAIVDSERRLSYAEADREINRMAHALHDRLGVGPGITVTLATDNRAEYLLAWFAVLRLGARAAHTSYRLTPRELEYQLRHSRSRVVLVSAASVEAAREACDRLGSDAPTLVTCGCDTRADRRELSYADVVAHARETPPSRPQRQDGGSVVYTSGTTGKPKGALRDFAAFGPFELTRVLEHLPFRFGESHAVVAPLYHSAPQVFAILVTALGGTLRLIPHFDPEATLRVINEESVSSTFLVPTMLRRILDLPPETLGRWPVPSLRAVVVGSSVFDQPLRERAVARFGPESVFDFYGATELGWVTLIRGDEMLQHPGSVGKPIAGQRVRILDAEGNDLPAGEVGLIYVQNQQTMSGYLDDAAATSAARRGPWTTVEDLGRVDAEGYLTVVGRQRDMVKSGGVNIYPVEIEEVLQRDESISEVAVIGVPDAEWGERLVGVVVPRGGPFDAGAVEQRAREHLAALKVPRRWELVDALPRNATGKVLKGELRARFGG